MVPGTQDGLGKGWELRFIATFIQLKVCVVEWHGGKDTIPGGPNPFPNMDSGFPICKMRKFEQIISHKPEL